MNTPSSATHPVSNPELALTSTAQPLAPMTNGHRSPAPLTVRSPNETTHRQRKGRSSRVKILVLVVGALLLLGGGGLLAFKYVPRLFTNERAGLLFHTVRPEKLEVTVVERGQLEAAENKDVICQVKATKGGNFST